MHQVGVVLHVRALQPCAHSSGGRAVGGAWRVGKAAYTGRGRGLVCVQGYVHGSVDE